MDEEYVAPPPVSADKEGEDAPELEKEASPVTDSIETHFQKADRHLAEENGSEAILELQEAARRLDPSDPRMILFHERMGSVYFTENNLTAAKESYTRAIKLSKDIQAEDSIVADVYAGMGLCLVRERNNAYAAKFFHKALTLDPSKGTRKAVEAELRRIEGASGAKP
jgi:Tfp pilus assembly protein PilF